MSNAATETPLRVAPQVYDAARALLRAGKNDEAIVKLAAIGAIAPDDVIAKELMFDAFFQKRDWLPARALAEDLVRRQPDVARLQKALIVTLSNMKRYDETIVEAARYIDRHGEDLTMLDALKVAHFIPVGSTKRSVTGSARSRCATPRPAAIRPMSP
jgi:predicted Zn-dependent protease